MAKFVGKVNVQSDKDKTIVLYRVSVDGQVYDRRLELKPGADIQREMERDLRSLGFEMTKAEMK